MLDVINLRLKAATEKAITKDGYFRSGDLATIDEEGFVYIKDRGKWHSVINFKLN